MTLPMVTVCIKQPFPMITLLTAEGSPSAVNEVANQGQTIVMTTSFICQQIDMGINDLMYQMLKQLAEIVKPMA